jgi:hypothetical protein
VENQSQLCANGNTNPNIKSIEILDSDLAHLELDVVTLQNMGIQEVSILERFVFDPTSS